MRRGRRPLALGLLGLCAALAGCGATAASGGGPTGPIGATSTAVERPGIDLALTTTDGEEFALSELRDHCVVLFLFATFDGASQAALRPARAFVEAHPDVRMVAIAVEDHPAELADAWAHALSPPFPVTYDPEGRVLEGTSPLGDIPSVPRFRLLDRDGVPRAEHVGYPRAGALDAMITGHGCGP